MTTVYYVSWFMYGHCFETVYADVLGLITRVPFSIQLGLSSSAVEFQSHAPCSVPYPYIPILKIFYSYPSPTPVPTPPYPSCILKMSNVKCKLLPRYPKMALSTPSSSPTPLTPVAPSLLAQSSPNFPHSPSSLRSSRHRISISSHRPSSPVTEYLPNVSGNGGEPRLDVPAVPLDALPPLGPGKLNLKYDCAAER